MELVGPVSQLVQSVWPSLVHPLRYVKDLKKNFKKLDEGIKHLCERREDINTEISRDTITKVPSKECQRWLIKVEQIENQVNEIGSKIKENRRSLKGCCFPDISSRKKLGKQVVNLLGDVTNLKEASDLKGGLLVDAPLAIVERVPLPPIKEGTTSTDHMVHHIMEGIRDDMTQKIGLWGMGGVGKTRIMKILNNLPEIAQTFEIVIWVTVSKDLNVRKVQSEIAERLGMNIDNKSDDRVARMLFQKLETIKYLLLLDDVWSQVNLEEVGVPRPNKEIGSKIVLTTRHRDVCRKMDIDNEIRIEALSKEEAWSLFQEKVGEVVDAPDIQPIARFVAEECDGLPLAVLVIGGSLRKVKDVKVWKNALEELRLATFEIGDMEDLVFRRLKFTYDHLKNDNVKKCFLYCSLYPEDHEIPVAELVEHWRAEGFTSGTQSLEKAYDKAQSILDSLIDASLLERTGHSLKMHDVIRDLALRITSLKGEGPRFLVNAGAHIEVCPEVEIWEEAERISLMANNLRDLPESPRCSSLSTLLLQSNWTLEAIPDLFFQYMHSLRVLNLCETRVQILPPSVSYLVNLRGLYLTGHPQIETLPSELGTLKKLEVLYLSTGVLPLEVEQLTNLRSLRLQVSGGQTMRTMCSAGVISSLSLLEDLRMYFLDPDILKQWCKMVDVAVAEELGSLKNLTSLKFEFSTLEYLEHFLRRRNASNWQAWREFELSVSCGFFSSWEVISEPDFGEAIRKVVRWCSGENVSRGIMQVLDQACIFELTDHKTARSLLDFGMQNINRLGKCKVQNCFAMETIADGKGSMNTVLPNLQKLWLWSLPNLKNLCNAPHRFTTLTYLNIDGCPKLRCVFTPGMIQYMSNLEHLRVVWCDEIEEIVMEEVEEGSVAVYFPRLKTLDLIKLDKLVRIWNGVSQTWPVLEYMKVYHCPTFKTLNLKVMDDASALRKISGHCFWWEALEWEGDDIKQRLEPLFEGL